MSIIYACSAAAGIRSRAARCLLAPKHGLAALSLCLHSSFLVCVLFLVSDNNSDEFGCCRWSLRTPGASLLVGREKGSQINPFHTQCKTRRLYQYACAEIRSREKWRLDALLSSALYQGVLCSKSMSVCVYVMVCVWETPMTV